MPKTYTCPNHPGLGALSSYCPDCCEAFANRRDPDGMTGDERAAEFDFWGPILTIPMGDLHQRIDELVGRGTWTHELADPDRLREEARTRQHPTPQAIFDQIPPEKRIFVVTDE